MTGNYMGRHDLKKWVNGYMYSAASDRDPEETKATLFKHHLQGRRYLENKTTFFDEEVKPVLENGIAALNQLCSFGPYLAGEFSMADIMAAYTFCYAAPVAQAIYGMDLMAEIPGLAAAIEATNARPAGKIVAAEHAEALAAFQAAQ